ncbi:hypothetical protein PMAYCL1PPCAC_12816 [Pristionchus mayeri]|uniref:Uncharacterized protein n=1 Tax=Pristionchus mayeri TaxID=1317129 RepID=A0AAN5CH40_9BILA|nr:hypothetical protein PMAYCL1PPCAC_12816 [Pristionchus mayeri]
MSAYQKVEQFDSIDEKKLVDPLYEDKFCKLFPGKLELVWYYFPTAKTKTILTSDIKRVFYKKQVFKEDLLMTKGWGKGCSNIWWACDMSRDLIHTLTRNGENVSWYNIVIDNGEKTLKGFTSTCHEHFLETLRPLLPSGSTISEGMP